MFLVEPNDAGSLFRVLARRPVFATWKDGSALLWDRTFARVWAERMELLGADLPATQRFADARPEILGAPSAACTTMTDDRAGTLARKFGLRYWLVRSDRPSAYSRAFQTRRYAILVLPVPQSSMGTAAAAGTPCVTLCGQTSAGRVVPYRCEHLAVRSPVACLGCPRRRCRRREGRCMDTIAASSVWSTLEPLLGQSSRPGREFTVTVPA